MKLATFLVPTHHRPLLLRACIKHLLEQRLVLSKWDYDIVVVGQPSDPSRDIVQFFPKCEWVDCDSPPATDKINHAVAYINNRPKPADLIMLADDDDLQAPDRAVSAISAFEEGADWSCSQEHVFVDLETSLVTSWKGGRKGLTGTTVSFTPALFAKTGGYPSVAKGKDGQLAALIERHFSEAVYQDLSSYIGAETVCLSHGNNIHSRKPRSEGQKRKVGGYQTLGLGELNPSMVSFSMSRTIQRLQRSQEVPMPEWTWDLEDLDEEVNVGYEDNYVVVGDQPVLGIEALPPEARAQVKVDPPKTAFVDPRLPRKTGRGGSRSRSRG